MNSAEDQTQLYFLDMLGVHDRLQDLLRENLADIRRTHSGFRSYTAPGGTHSILPRPECYTPTVDDLALRDWVAALLDQGAPRDVGASLLEQPRP